MVEDKADDLASFDDNLTQASRYVDQNFHVKLVASINHLKLTKDLCDVTLFCDGEEIVAHKLVLAAASEYFCAMFAGGLTEANLNKIELKDLESESVKSLVNFAYTGTLNVDSSNVQSLLESADLLQFKAAKDYCGEFIAKQIDQSNCLDIYQLADRYSCEQLASRALCFFKSHFNEITHQEQFLSLNLISLKKLLQSNEIFVSEEGDVLCACLEWLQYDPESRVGHRLELLQCIKIPFIGPKKLRDIVNKYGLKESVFHSKNKKFITNPGKSNRNNVENLSMRSSYQHWLYIFGGERSFLNEINDVECFNHAKGCWELCKPLKGPRSSFAAVVISNRLYVVGGMRRSVKLRSAKCFDSETGKWTTLSPPLKCRGDVKAAAIGEILYVAGGSGDRESACRYLEKYDPATKTWTKLQKMMFRRRRFNLVAVNEQLYALGGFDDKQGDLDSVEHYDPNTDRWMLDASMITARNDFGAVALSGCIYVVGGVNRARGSLDLVERYDPNANSWTQCSSMQNCRGGLSVAIYFGRIVAISGINIYMSLIETAEYYDETEDKWFEFQSLQIARSGSVAVGLPFRMPSQQLKSDEKF